MAGDKPNKIIASLTLHKPLIPPCFSRDMHNCLLVLINFQWSKNTCSVPNSCYNVGLTQSLCGCQIMHCKCLIDLQETRQWKVVKKGRRHEKQWKNEEKWHLLLSSGSGASHTKSHHSTGLSLPICAFRLSPVNSPSQLHLNSGSERQLADVWCSARWYQWQSSPVPQVTILYWPYNIGPLYS